MSIESKPLPFQKQSDKQSLVRSLFSLSKEDIIVGGKNYYNIIIERFFY